MNKVFITGMARSGTSLMTYLLKYFHTCFVVDGHEIHPLSHEHVLRHSKTGGYTHFAFKQPFGYFKHFPPKYSYRQLTDAGIKIISLVRDPRDVLVSRHNKNKSKYWALIDTTKNAANEHLDNLNNSSVLPIKYEELVTSPKKVMDKISSFIGLEYSENFVNFYKTVDKSQPMAVALNTPRPISSSSIGNWKKPEHEARVREILKDEELNTLIKRLGYQ